MPTKKTITKKVAPAEAGWDKVESVKTSTKPEFKAPPPVANDVPFGSPSELTVALRKARQAWNEADVPKSGTAISPQGNHYNYYLTEDVMAFFDRHFSSTGFLDIDIQVENGMNIMRLILNHYISGESKIVTANLGSPTSMADFGSRITYAPKYLLAVMFGISIQTDSDAFGTGINKNNQIQHAKQSIDNNSGNNSVSPNSDVSSGDSKSIDSTNIQPVNSNNPVSATVSGNVQTGHVDHSSSYPIAKNFIEKASSVILLDQAEVKVTNAKGLYDDEKAELFVLIQERRSQLG